MEEIEIWRAANQLLNQFPEDANMVAAQRADAAYEQGDLCNFNLWGRVAKAVQTLQHVKPSGEALN